MVFNIVDFWIPLAIVGGIILLGIIIYLSKIVVVPFNEIHVVSRKKKVTNYDGKGRYTYFPIFMGRTIIPKHVLDIEPPLIKLHDQDNLPFGVEVSVKVQVSDPQKAAATLTRIDHNTVSKVVEDTVMSAARSIAMERTILDVMKKREEIEESIYTMVSDALGKLGLSAIIFDIKNIRDVDGTDVIGSLEKVKTAELEKDARKAQSTHMSEAKIHEVEKEKEALVKTEQMQQEQEQAQMEREKTKTVQLQKVDQEKIKLKKQAEKANAEIERDRMMIEAQSAKEREILQAEAAKEKKLIEAQANADAINIQAEAEAKAIRLKLEAEANGIQKKGEAEAEVLRLKNEAMKEGKEATTLEALKILISGQIQSSEKIATALGQNNKVVYLPPGNDLMSNFLPKLDQLNDLGIIETIKMMLSKNQ